MSKYENFNKTVDICRAAREFHSANIFSVHILILRLSKKDIKNECNYVFYSPEKPFTYQIKLKYFFFPPSVLKAQFPPLPNSIVENYNYKRRFIKNLTENFPQDTSKKKYSSFKQIRMKLFLLQNNSCS